MNHKINASTLVTKHSLEITEHGVEYLDTAVSRDVRAFPYEQINAVLRGADSTLSFQAGEETFKIPIKSDNAAHRAAVARLLSEVRRTVRRVT